MASKKKHAARSQRSSHNRIPLGIFYQHAARVHEARYQKGMAEVLGQMLKGKGDEE